VVLVVVTDSLKALTGQRASENLDMLRLKGEFEYQRMFALMMRL